MHRKFKGIKFANRCQVSDLLNIVSILFKFDTIRVMRSSIVINIGISKV